MFTWSQFTNANPAIVQSPMAGYTDSAYKQIARMVAPEAVVVTEFVSTDALYYDSPKSLRMIAFDECEHPVILQVFGKTPERFVAAAKKAEAMGYDGIDINMGCPAKKVIKSDHGSALVKIKNRCVAMQIVSDMARAVKIPVSVKTRIGWENADDLVDFCKELEKNGCAAVTIHGRTTVQGYRGEADWEPIYELKKNLSIPVFGNGDITSVSSFRSKLGNLDGVYVARGTFGDPWILQDLLEYSRNRTQYDQLSDEQLDEKFPRSENIPWDKKLPVILRHCELAVKCKGEKLGMLEMRKHLAAYIKGLPGARELREKLVRVETYSEAGALLLSTSGP
ncbi:MAG: tRNA-dihydrouridine synthase [bacterium]|nr:tRNA-dihydrouridine synthase [bacterium]